MRAEVTSPLCRPRHNGKEVTLTASQRLPHTRWEGKSHVGFIPQYRRKVWFAARRKDLGPVFREWARHTAGRVAEGQLRPDHVHLRLSLPPTSAVAALVGYLKGKRAIPSART